MILYQHSAYLHSKNLILAVFSLLLDQLLKRILFLLLFIAICNSEGYSQNASQFNDDSLQWQTDYQHRKDWLLSQFKDFKNFHGNPKAGLPQVLAKLFITKGTDTLALGYASRSMDYNPPKSPPTANYQEIFTYPGLARFLYMFGDKLSAQQRAHLMESLTSRGKDFLDHGTENHAIMRITSGYLFAQYLPDAKWSDQAGNPQTSAQIMAKAKDLLKRRGQGFFQSGDGEILSPTYAIINIYPLLNLYDFAKDPEVRAMAHALILYHFSYLCVNDFDGYLLPPYDRQNFQQAQFEKKKTSTTTTIRPLTWLYWGQNELIPEDLTNAPEPAFSVFFALSNWTPPYLLTQIARGVGAPYSIRSSLPFFGFWGQNKPNATLRSAYREKQFAIGACAAQQLQPEGYNLSYNLMGIAWKSTDQYRFLECMQPYWRSNEGEDTWFHGTASPFQQMLHHKNTLIVLYNIPKQDPWPGRGQKGQQAQWMASRDQHYNQLLQVGECRFPKSIDELTQSKGWYFLREGNVYIGVRPLRALSQLDTAQASLQGFYSIKSRQAKSGFVIEVGTKETNGSFTGFQQKLLINPIKIDWDSLTVSYQNTTGDQLKIHYNSNLTANSNGLIDLTPQTWVNNQAINFSSWPLLESPFVNLKDKVLTIQRGPKKLEINWQLDLPSFN